MIRDDGPPAPDPAGGPGERPGGGRGGDSEPLSGGEGARPEGEGAAPEEERAAPGEDGPIGIFPSWSWVYGAVLAWFVVVVVALYLLTVALDFGAP